MRTPTNRQLAILDHLDAWIASHANTSPTFRELAEAAGCRSVRTVTEHVQALRRKGLVTHQLGETRTLFLTPAGVKALATWDRAQAPSALE